MSGEASDPANMQTQMKQVVPVDASKADAEAPNADAEREKADNILKSWETSNEEIQSTTVIAAFFFVFSLSWINDHDHKVFHSRVTYNAFVIFLVLCNSTGLFCVLVNLVIYNCMKLAISWIYYDGNYSMREVGILDEFGNWTAMHLTISRLNQYLCAVFFLLASSILTWDKVQPPEAPSNRTLPGPNGTNITVPKKPEDVRTKDLAITAMLIGMGYLLLVILTMVRVGYQYFGVTRAKLSGGAGLVAAARNVDQQLES